MGSDVEGGLQQLVASLRQAADLDLFGLVDQAFRFQQTFTKGVAFYLLQVLLEAALDFPLEQRLLAPLAERAAPQCALFLVAIAWRGEMGEAPR